MAVSSPLLEASIDGAHGVLLSISGGSDLGLFEINEAAALVVAGRARRGQHHLRCRDRRRPRRRGPRDGDRGRLRRRYAEAPRPVPAGPASRGTPPPLTGQADPASAGVGRRRRQRDDRGGAPSSPGRARRTPAAGSAARGHRHANRGRSRSTTTRTSTSRLPQVGDREPVASHRRVTVFLHRDHVAAQAGRVDLAFTDRHGGVSTPPFDSLDLGRSREGRDDELAHQPVAARRRLRGRRIRDDDARCTARTCARCDAPAPGRRGVRRPP